MKKIKTLIRSLERNPASGRFIPFVDGLRFLAIMPVIFQHANERLFKYNPHVQTASFFEEQLSFLISRGTIGVFIFFALSGFVLSLPFAKGTQNFSYKKYLGRRLTRIEPPFIFWMSCFAFVLILQGNLGLGEIFKHYLATITYSHSIVYGEYSIINPVAWSLEVEIQFYLIAPFVAMMYFNEKHTITRRSFLVAFLFIFISFQYILGWNLHPLKPSLLGHLQHFLIGMLAADFYVNRKEVSRFDQRLWDLIVPALLVIMAYSWTDEYFKTLLFNIALFLVFIASFKGRYFPRILSLKWITIIGGMCYTIYLTHLPLLELAYSIIGKFGYSSAYFVQLSISLIIAIPMVLLSSIIFYKAIEQPFMNAEKVRQMKLKIRSLTYRRAMQAEK